jgi:hypothetical protein
MIHSRGTMNRQAALTKNLTPGKVYRRSDLAQWSTSIDRHLAGLVKEGRLKKVGPGLYLAPKKTTFGESAAKTEDLVRTFLKDDRFHVLSFNSYNSLGLGTTQLYNQTLVYNHKRHGKFKLGALNLDFRMKADLPDKLTKEFLVVDMLNNLNELAEDKKKVLAMLERNIKKFNQKSLLQMAQLYGKVRTKKLLRALVDGKKVSPPRQRVY